MYINDTGNDSPFISVGDYMKSIRKT